MCMSSFPEELTDIIQRREGDEDHPRTAPGLVQKIGAVPERRGERCRHMFGKARTATVTRSAASASPRPRKSWAGCSRRTRSRSSASPRPRGGSSIPFLKREKVRLKDLAVYSRQLSVLIDAELPLIQSLGILEEQQKNTYFKNVIKTVKDDVEAGSTLNQAKRKHPKAFDDLYCNLIASGEQSGSLDIMLRRLSEFIEKNVRLRSKVKQAMIYPVAIVIFAIIVAIFLLWKVIPVFAKIFRDLGAELPWLTAMVVRLSDFVQKYIFFVFAGIIAFDLRFPLLPEHHARPLVDRPPHPEDAPLRQAPLQGGHDPGHPDAGDAHLRRRAHARGPEDHLDDGRQRHHREGDHRRPQARLRRQDDGRILQAMPGSSRR